MELTAQAEIGIASSLEDRFKVLLREGAERLRSEKKYETSEMLARELEYISDHLAAILAPRAGEDADAALLRTAEYLGAENYELRWKLEHQRLDSRRELESEARMRWAAAMELFDRGRTEEARYAFGDLAVTAGLKCVSQQYLGLIALGEGDVREAVKYFENARRLAETDEERGAACSHLAWAWAASGDSVRAAKAALSAAEANPERRRYWYDAAVYCGRLPDSEHFEEFLVSAIERDWVYWAVAAADLEMEPVRDRIAAVLDQMREEQRRAARVQLDRLRDIFTTLSGAEVRSAVLASLELSHNLEDQFVEGCFFTFRDVEVAAMGAQRELIHRASEAYENRLRLLEAAIGEVSSPAEAPPQPAGKANKQPVPGGASKVEIGVKVWSAICMLAIAYYGATAIVNVDRSHATEQLYFWGMLLLAPVGAFWGHRRIQRRRNAQPAPAVVETPPPPDPKEKLIEELAHMQKQRESLKEYLALLDEGR